MSKNATGSHSELSPKLSQGSKKPDHKTYQHNQQLINSALCKNLANRSIDVRASDVYRTAHITAPTFYFHHRNIEDARNTYEATLESDLDHYMPPHAGKKTFFVILTAFIVRNQEYFLTVSNNKDGYLLSKLMTNHRLKLVGNKINNRLFEIYVGKLAVVLTSWLSYDQLTLESSATCVDHLMHVRVGEVW